MKIIIEGTDGVGKSTTIKRLAKNNIICQDRSRNVICCLIYLWKIE